MTTRLIGDEVLTKEDADGLYLTIDKLPKNNVTTDTAQTITGNKTFTGETVLGKTTIDNYQGLTITTNNASVVLKAYSSGSLRVPNLWVEGILTVNHKAVLTIDDFSRQNTWSAQQTFTQSPVINVVQSSSVNATAIPNQRWVQEYVSNNSTNFQPKIKTKRISWSSCSFIRSSEHSGLYPNLYKCTSSDLRGKKILNIEIDPKDYNWQSGIVCSNYCMTGSDLYMTFIWSRNGQNNISNLYVHYID